MMKKKGAKSVSKTTTVVDNRTAREKMMDKARKMQGGLNTM